MLKFFRLPFATTGDKTAVPDAVDSNGKVSYSQGYGFDYQRQKTDPAAKNIERDKMNQIFFDITTAIAEIQAQGVPDYITSALNGGSAYSYGQYAIVKYSGDLYISLVAANTALPSDATKWALLPVPSRLQSALNTRATAGGTANALTGAFTPAIASLPAAPDTLSVMVRAAAANTTTTPTFAADGTAAKTIVKGANQALVAGDIAGAGHWLHLDYDATLDKWVLQNPANGLAFPYPVPVAAAGTVDALTATFTPSLSLTAGKTAVVRAAGANTSAAPTFSPDGLTAKTIVKGANQALVAGDIAGAGHWLFLNYDATLDKWVLLNPATGLTASTTYLWVRDEKASGTAPQSLTTAVWNQRVLNTVKANTISGASLASNQFVLPAGTYEIDATAPCSPGTAGAFHKAKLRNVTDSADTIIGTSEAIIQTNTAATVSRIRGQFTIAAMKTFEIDHYSTVTTPGGNAVTAGVVEVYAEVYIRKIS